MTRKLLSVLFALTLIAIPMASAIDLPNEDLNYSVLYRWGLINKQAGAATLSLRTVGNRYNAQLTARTLPWADKIFKVRDTLRSTMIREQVLPQQYVKIAHEGKVYDRDVVQYSYTATEAIGLVNRYHVKAGLPPMRIDTVLHAKRPTFDMLSVFYYLRTIDFPSMTTGQTRRVHLFSGHLVEELTITYRGIKTLQLPEGNRSTYYLTFSFTTNGRPASDAMSTWISADAQRIPLKVEGKLPIGKVQAIYTGPAR